MDKIYALDELIQKAEERTGMEGLTRRLGKRSVQLVQLSMDDKGDTQVSELSEPMEYEQFIAFIENFKG